MKDMKEITREQREDMKSLTSLMTCFSKEAQEQIRGKWRELAIKYPARVDKSGVRVEDPKLEEELWAYVDTFIHKDHNKETYLFM